jgi:DNA-binding transcriptional ArsR family regulator
MPLARHTWFVYDRTMKDGASIVGIAALIGDHARAEVLTALMADRALTATELAGIAGVTKQTISAHLAKLVDAGLVAVDSQGRHRYFRLADRDVAHLLESLMGVAFRTGALRARASPREPALRKARVCYDHLAGEVGRADLRANSRAWRLRAEGRGSEAHTRGRAHVRQAPDRYRGAGRAESARYAVLASTGASAATIWPAHWARRSSAASSSSSGRRGRGILVS